jgi:hypothetical protein
MWGLRRALAALLVLLAPCGADKPAGLHRHGAGAWPRAPKAKNGQKDLQGCRVAGLGAPEGGCMRVTIAHMHDAGTPARNLDTPAPAPQRPGSDARLPCGHPRLGQGIVRTRQPSGHRLGRCSVRPLNPPSVATPSVATTPHPHPWPPPLHPTPRHCRGRARGGGRTRVGRAAPPAVVPHGPHPGGQVGPWRGAGVYVCACVCKGGGGGG